MNPATWLKDSSVKFHRRSTQLQAIDVALAQYANNKNKINLYALTDAFLNWYGKADDFDWLDSIRRLPMIGLVNYIKAEAKVVVPAVGGWIFNRRQAKRMIAQMKANPEPFLLKYPLAIAGEPDSPACDFRVKVDSMDMLFTADDLPNTATYGPPDRLTIAVNGIPFGAKMTAVSLKMHTDFTAASTAATLLLKLYPVVGGDVVLTGRLTGCSYVIRWAAGLRCTHIQPMGQDGLTLQTQLEGFHLPSTKVYGKRDYGDYYTNIIGFNNGGWNIYSQRTAHKDVVSVDRIYP